MGTPQKIPKDPKSVWFQVSILSHYTSLNHLPNPPNPPLYPKITKSWSFEDLGYPVMTLQELDSQASLQWLRMLQEEWVDPGDIL